MSHNLHADLSKNLNSLAFIDFLEKYSRSEITVSYKDINGLKINVFLPNTANILARNTSSCPIYPIIITSCFEVSKIYFPISFNWAYKNWNKNVNENPNSLLLNSVFSHRGTWH